MGQIFSSIFGGGMDLPDAPDYGSAPERDNAEAEGIATRDAERKKNRALAGGVRSTLISNPLGGNGQAGNTGGLLGRTASQQGGRV